MKKNDKLELELLNDGHLIATIKTKREPEKMAGHMFVGLLGQNKYQNYLTLLLKIYKHMPFKKTPEETKWGFTDIGHILEDKILDYEWGEGTYISFDRDDDYVKGNKYVYKDYKGLIDGKHKTLPIIAEVKNHVSWKKLIGYVNDRMVKILPNEYYLQLRYYLWLYSILHPEWKLEYGVVITHKFPFSYLDYPIEDIKVVPKNINTFKVYNSPNDGFDKLVKIATNKRKHIISKKQIKVKYDNLTRDTIENLKQLNNKIEIIWKNTK